LGRCGRVQQLVIQFPLNAAEPDTDELETLAALEARLERISDGKFEVDGHDFGSSEMNIFIFAADAKSALDSIRVNLPARSWRAGFRDVDSEDYSPLAPAGLATFEVQ